MQNWTVGGVNLAHTDEASWYCDWNGGKNGAHQGVDTIQVLRITDDLVEVALADTQGTHRQLTQHIVMTSDTTGLYTYVSMTVVSTGEGLNEIRHNTRWDRCLLNHAYNHERPTGEQPTYPYLYTQDKIQDETWQVDGKSNASLLCPADNAGDVGAGAIYTKYDWSLYHHENPFFGIRWQQPAFH
jgi:rhamnogalacturonan endolyase